MKKKDIKACPYSHKPNKITIKAIEDAKKRKNVTKYKDLAELFKNLGI